MFTKPQYLLAVISLTIVTFTRSLYTKVDSDVISKALNCTFMSNYASDTKSYCSLIDLDQYDDKFHRINYACMELYDVSLQLCEVKDVKSDSVMVPPAKEFCEKLKFYDKRNKLTGQWANIAVKFLSIPANCEKVCINENSVHPICKAIYLGNSVLIKAAEERRPVSSQKPVVYADKATNSQSNPTPSETLSSSLRDHSNKEPATYDKESATYDKESATYYKESVAYDKEPAKVDLTKPVKLRDSKDEIKVLPEISMVGKSLESNLPERVSGSGTDKESDDLTHTDANQMGEPERINSGNAPSVMQTKNIDGSQSLGDPSQFSEHRSLDNGPQTPEKVKHEGSQSLSPGIPLPSVTPSTNPEIVYKYSAAEHDENRDSSKDVDLENEGNGEDYTGSSVLAQEESSNIYASDEPADNQVITSNVYSSNYTHSQDSHFFAYFLTMVVICIVGYLVFHNKQKIIALALEGRRMQGSRRRPNTSSYKKLDSNLEEAVTSNCSSSSVTHVIF